MRLLLGLILWVGTPLYWLGALGIRVSDSMPPFDLGTGIVMAVLAVGLGVGEYVRATQRSRREQALRAQQEFWLSQRR